MERVVGKRVYRGLLKSVARVWTPKEIQDKAIQEKVLAHMQAAERGPSRAKAARDKASPGVFAAVLEPLRLSSLDQVDNLKTLQQIVIARSNRDLHVAASLFRDRISSSDFHASLSSDHVVTRQAAPKVVSHVARTERSSDG